MKYNSLMKVFYQGRQQSTIKWQQKNMELFGPHAPKRRNANVQPYITKSHMLLK